MASSQRGIDDQLEPDRGKTRCEPKLSADEDTAVIEHWLDEIAETAGNMFSGVDRCLVDSLESPVAQSLSGKIGVPNDVGQCGTVGFGGEAGPEAELSGYVADAV